MLIERNSPCKVNFLLNILGKRPDGYHELETILHPVALHDQLTLARAGSGLELTCSDPALPADATNLAHRAATKFLNAGRIKEGVRIHLEKRIPLAAGLGGGSSNAAHTLLGLNELFGQPLAPRQLQDLAAELGSDVPFFLQTQPALATGRGERIVPLNPFPALQETFVLLIHPGFGISAAWAYQHLAHFPEALQGAPGRGEQLIALLQTSDLPAAGRAFYNALEIPALRKYPLLALFQDFLRANGAGATLLSGSGSATFALVDGKTAAERLVEQFRLKFGDSYWLAMLAL